MHIVKQIQVLFDVRVTEIERIMKLVHSEEATKDECEAAIMLLVEAQKLAEILGYAWLEYRSFRWGERDDIRLGKWPKIGKKIRTNMNHIKKMRLRVGVYSDPNWKLTARYLLG